MSAIPYRLSQELSRKVFRFPFQVYRALHEVLISGDGIGLLTQFWRQTCDEDPFSVQAFFFVLKHISLRTLSFSKVFEFIRIRDIAEGLPTVGISGAPIKESTIKGTLKKLTKSRVIIKLQLPKSKAVTALYGLNLPVILTCLDVWWEEAIEERDLDLDNFDALTRSAWSRRTQKNLKCLSEYFGHFEETFKFLTNQQLPITDFEDFVNRLKLSVAPEKELAYEDGDIAQKLKTASRVRRKDLTPDKWNN